MFKNIFLITATVLLSGAASAQRHLDFDFTLGYIPHTKKDWTLVTLQPSFFLRGDQTARVWSMLARGEAFVQATQEETFIGTSFSLGYKAGPLTMYATPLISRWKPKTGFQVFSGAEITIEKNSKNFGLKIWNFKDVTIPLLLFRIPLI